MLAASDGHEIAKRRRVQGGGSKDAGFLCVVCKSVFWVDGLDNAISKFCPLCGSRLAADARVSFSKIAKEEDESIDRRLAACFAKNSPRLSSLCPTPSQHEAAGSPKTGCDGPALMKKTRFCEVCGYASDEVHCSSCTSVYHKRCLFLPETFASSFGWRCHSCMHDAMMRHKFSPGPTLRQGKTKLSSVSKLCSSCGYFEPEALNCDVCCRWFCYGCMCISQGILPPNGWACSECVGQREYDEDIGKKLETSRSRFVAGLMSRRERDGYSQLVFDLFCCCFWEEWEKNVGLLIEDSKKCLETGTLTPIMPYHSLHYPIDKSMIRSIAEVYSKVCSDKARSQLSCKAKSDASEPKVTDADAIRTWRMENIARKPEDGPSRLRIGYISSDFVDHPTADLIVRSLLLHDRDRFDVYCYSITNHANSEYRRALKNHIPNFKNLAKKDSDDKCAEIIAQDGIHILINLNGHTAGDRNGISSLRPAPIQVVYLAYPGTTGADYIDYNVVDDYVCPPEHREFYSEKLIRMPHCYQVNSFNDLYQDVLRPEKLPTRRDHFLPDKPAVVFCNFCRLGRISKELFDTWLRILKRVPGSVLWLYSHPRAAANRLREYARRQELPAHRIVFAPPCSPKLQHMKRLTLADLYLDTLVYNGHTTASDVLWAGVPILTVKGSNWPSLVATSLAHSVGMPEMVAASLHEYEEIAVDLACNGRRLQGLRAKLSRNRLTQPLFDNERWVRSFENALEKVWLMWEKGGQLVDIQPEDFGESRSTKALAEEFQMKV